MTTILTTKNCKDVYRSGVMHQGRTFDSFWYMLVCQVPFKPTPNTYLYFFWAKGTLAGVVSICTQLYTFNPQVLHYFPAGTSNSQGHILPFNNYVILHTEDVRGYQNVYETGGSSPVIRDFGLFVFRILMRFAQQPINTTFFDS